MADPLMQQTIPSPQAKPSLAEVKPRLGELQRRASSHPSAATPTMAAQKPLTAQQRHDLIHQAAAHEAVAQAAAARGEIEESARRILQALDCERRAGSLGPQVLQVIKPRA